jgi:hypothetical protein
MFDFEKGNLLKTRKRLEFEIVKSVYGSNFISIEDLRPNAQCERTSAKAGLKIEDQLITIADMDRWSQISISQKTETWTMPITKNCQELMNGHMETKCPGEIRFRNQCCVVQKSIHEPSPLGSGVRLSG